MKRIATIIFTCIIGLSMTLMPAIIADQVYADDTQEQAEQTQETAEAAVDELNGDMDAAEEETEEEPEVSAAGVTGTGAAEGTPLEDLDGLYVSDIENDPEISWVLEDPTFYRYYEVDEDGLITQRLIMPDETEQFLAEADANADGIEDVDNVETDGLVTAMGGGVTGLGKAQTPARYSSYNRYHCVDISWWQGKVSDANWKKVKAAGVTHAIIRCGYSALSGGDHNMDSTFSDNLNGAYKAGIKVGVYYYSTAVSAAEAKSEAQYVTKIIENYKSKITLPVAYDYETGGRLTSSVMKKVGTASCTAFCDTIKAAGYTPMVYANYTTLCNWIDYKTLQSKYKIWLANYTTKGVATTYPGDFWMWQYSSSGKVNGLPGSIDINYVFEPKTSAPAGTPSVTTEKPSADAVAAAPYKAKTTTTINYRIGPGFKYKIKGTYKKGKKLRVVSQSANWARLSNGYYVYLKYIKKYASASKYPYKAKTKTDVNYRTGPSTGSSIAGTYNKGKRIKITAEKNGWGKMSNGYYIYLKYVK